MGVVRGGNFGPDAKEFWSEKHVNEQKKRRGTNGLGMFSDEKKQQRGKS